MNKFQEQRIRSGFIRAEDLAKAVGVRREAVSLMECGKTKTPLPQTLLLIADEFEMTTDDVLNLLK